MSDIRTETRDGVLEIVFDRAHKKNALTDAMYGVFADALEAAEVDPAIRCVLIRGEGDDFTAGNDIADFLGVASGGKPVGALNVGRVLMALANAGMPVIAAVTGRAIGIGTTMLLHCDAAYVAKDAKLSTPFVDLALVPEAASSILLPAAIGAKRAFEMFALGRALDGREAEALGLVTRALPAGGVLAAAREAAAELAKRAPGALATTKRLMRDRTTIVAKLHEENEAFGDRLRSPEAREVFAAFMEKRAPDFGRI